MRIYTENELAEHIRDYADYHEVELEAVGVSTIAAPYTDGPGYIGFRLSLDVDGVSRGCDETFGDI